MIRFISHYRQQYHFERDYWLTRAEKRRAIRLMSLIVACLVISLLLWSLR